MIFLGGQSPVKLAWAMFRPFLLLLAAAWLTGAPATDPAAILHTDRSSPGDLEVGGELAGLPPESTRFIRYEDLLGLPQETYTVSDDFNFHGKTAISGIPLTTLAQFLGQSADMIVAICYDRYRTNYPRDYLAVHHPLLVLLINGQPRGHWPPSENGGPLGPYLISHPFFKPSFKVLSHDDEPQIPYGVTRIEFRRESRVFGAIRPPGKWPADSAVEQGYAIARQDCFRCHNMDAEGGTMAAHSWLQLAAIANADGPRFRHIIRNPASVTPGAKMPAHSDYDDQTLDALTAYFKTFAGDHSSPGAHPGRDRTP
jgi:mono/diheme cytochrome c family protein